MPIDKHMPPLVQAKGQIKSHNRFLLQLMFLKQENLKLELQPYIVPKKKIHTS